MALPQRYALRMAVERVGYRADALWKVRKQGGLPRCPENNVSWSWHVTNPPAHYGRKSRGTALKEPLIGERLIASDASLSAEFDVIEPIS